MCIFTIADMEIDPDNLTIWQVAAGYNGLYADVFIDNRVALIGPGDPGEWNENLPDEVFEGSHVRRFANELNIGDILLLRIGRSMVKAIGLVVCNYQYLEQFNDVYGWDLQHSRRVRWCVLNELHQFDTHVLPRYRFSRVYNEIVIEYVREIIETHQCNWQLEDLVEIRNEENLELHDLPDNLQDFVGELCHLQECYWNDNFGEDMPTEDELVSHLVIPFLKALGWQLKNIGVEWRNVDISVFSDLPRTPENCKFLIEVKRNIQQNFKIAVDQVRTYAEQLDVLCNIVVTDGKCYWIFDPETDGIIAHANFEQPKQSALDLIDLMINPNN